MNIQVINKGSSKKRSQENFSGIKTDVVENVDSQTAFGGSDLGNDREIVQPLEGGGLKKLSKWTLQEIATEILQTRAMKTCHRHRRIGAVGIFLVKHEKEGQKSYTYNGLMRCGSVWNCPICSLEISQARVVEVSRAIERHKKEGGEVVMVTYTVPHHMYDNLRELLDKFQLARRKMKNRKNYKRLMEGSVGTIRALEVTYGVNGWHVHVHELVFLRKGVSQMRMVDNSRDMTTIQNKEDYNLLAMWQSACVDVGLGMPSAKHGVLVQNGEQADSYVSKWGTAAELVLSGLKKGGESYTPWEMLAAYHAGDKRMGEVFAEYAKVFKGRRQLVWSDGLKSMYDIEEKTDEELIEESENMGEIEAEIDVIAWGFIVKNKIRGQVLEVAKLGGVDAVRQYLNRLSDGMGNGVKDYEVPEVWRDAV